MAKFKVFHQVTIDEYIAMQEDLFPDTPVVSAPVDASRPVRRVCDTTPIFPGAIDGTGATPGVAAPLQVVRSFGRSRKVV